MEDPSALAELAAHTWLNAGKAKWTGLIERLSLGNSQERFDSSLEELAAGTLGEETFILGYDPLGFSELLLSSIESSDSFGGTFSSQDEKLRLIKIQPPGRNSTPIRISSIGWKRSARQLTNGGQKKNCLVWNSDLPVNPHLLQKYLVAWSMICRGPECSRRFWWESFFGCFSADFGPC